MSRVYDAPVTQRDSNIHCTLESGPITPSPADRCEPAGAQVIFIGRTRPEFHPEFGGLVALEYEAHESLALNSMRDLCRELHSEFALLSISLKHAVDRVAVGEASIELQVTAPHRAQAIAACAAGIDRLKQRVPIWKRECWKNGSTWSEGSAIRREQRIS